MSALAHSLPGPRLVRAEILKLRKRRGLLAIVAAATIGASVVAYGTLAILHAANAAHHGPAGGVLNLGHGLFVLALLGSVAAILAGATVVFAGYRIVPSAGLLAGSGAWFLLSCAFWFLLALGLASVVGSRSTVIGVLLAFQLAVTPILSSIPALGPGRELLPEVALTRLAPHAVRGFVGNGNVVPTSLGTAELVLAVWALGLLALGEWRTATRSA
jgi:hypothetical protein